MSPPELQEHEVHRVADVVGTVMGKTRKVREKEYLCLTHVAQEDDAVVIVRVDGEAVL
jgi:hypothetical protein